jgi:hypothetical protein
MAFHSTPCRSTFTLIERSASAATFDIELICVLLVYDRMAIFSPL